MSSTESMARRILHCCPTSLDPRLGTAKVYLESAAAFRTLGWQADVVGVDEIAAATAPADQATRLGEYLRRRAGEYDVVEYEHSRLPLPRRDFSASTLMVARSVLLTHHLLRYPIPNRPGLRYSAAAILKGPLRRKELLDSIADGTRTFAEADVANVSNDDDAVELQRCGIDAGKIVVFPFGLLKTRRRELEAAPLAPPERPAVAFVGTFDPRKGMRIFPQLVESVIRAVPGIRFKLIGTAGMLRTADEVYRQFPAALRPAIEVIPQFDPHELPHLLGDCSVGVFPSLVEGFGFGVLEMLCAGLPVVAFQAPGPPMMLADEYLVAKNDAAAMAARVVALLKNQDRLAAARVAARERSRDFDWDEIIGRTADEYERRLQVLRS